MVIGNYWLLRLSILRVRNQRCWLSILCMSSHPWLRKLRLAPKSIELHLSCQIIIHRLKRCHQCQCLRMFSNLPWLKLNRDQRPTNLSITTPGVTPKTQVRISMMWPLFRLIKRASSRKSWETRWLDRHAKLRNSLSILCLSRTAAPTLPN